MALDIREDVAEKIVEVDVHGKLTDEDYKQFIPRIEAIISRMGKIRLLVDMSDFHGMEMKAAWDDMKFGTRHAKDFSRLAVVGEKRWQGWLSRAWGLFMSAPVEFFNSGKKAEALAWLTK